MRDDPHRDGPLAESVRSFVTLKRSLGMSFSTEAGVLRRLDRFVMRCYPDAGELSRPILEAWFDERPNLTALTRAHQLGIARQLCLYRRRFDSSAYVPDKTGDPGLWARRIPRRRPYIFSVDEVQKLLRTTLELPPYRANRFRPQTFFNLVLLLYTTGMRVSEAHALRVGDVNWSDGTLLIRETKFYKTRLVPVASDVLESIRNYHAALKLPRGRSAVDLPVFQKAGHCSYRLGSIEAFGRELLYASGLKVPADRAGPRLHDIRHTFACHCIARWYEQGRDVQNLLPRLATYMGHKNLKSTQHYLRLTIAILHRAGKRFESACAPGAR